MKKNVFALLLVVLSISLYSCSMIHQEDYIFYPEKLSPSFVFSFPAPFEEVNFKTADNVMINGLLFKAEASKGIVFYLHGNAGSLRGWGSLYEDFIKRGYDVLFIDYRGFGKSTGVIENEEQLHADAKFVYQNLAATYGEEKIVVYGRSLGTGIAAKLASEQAPKLAILETPYYNFVEVASHHFPSLVVKLMLKYRLETNKYITKIKCPVYMFQGTNDQTIPYEHSQRLAKLSDNIHLTILKEGTHNNLGEFPEYQEQLTKLLKE